MVAVRHAGQMGWEEAGGRDGGAGWGRVRRVVARGRDERMVDGGLRPASQTCRCLEPAGRQVGRQGGMGAGEEDGGEGA
jgi:hypothetical protein